MEIKNVEDKGWIKKYNNILTIILIVLIGVLLVQQLFCISTVSGNSMYPTLKNGQFVSVKSRNNKNINVNDIIMFYPKNQHLFSDKHVKRVVAMPGDTVVIKEGFLYVNDKKIETDFPKMYDAGIASEPVELKADEFFVLGDNRNASTDSRETGAVKRENIIGVIR